MQEHPSRPFLCHISQDRRIEDAKGERAADGAQHCGDRKQPALGDKGLLQKGLVGDLRAPDGQGRPHAGGGCREQVRGGDSPHRPGGTGHGLPIPGGSRCRKCGEDQGGRAAGRVHCVHPDGVVRQFRGRATE